MQNHKSNLRGFLRRDISLRRNKLLDPYRKDFSENRNTATKRDTGATHPLNRLLPSLRGAAEEDEEDNEGELVDSIFEEPIYTEEELRQMKVEEFLAEDLKQRLDDHNQAIQSRRQNPILELLKEDLGEVVSREVESKHKEKQTARCEKSELVSLVRKLEAKNEGERYRSHKLNAEELEWLQPPIGIGEKKKMQAEYNRNRKCALGLERPPKSQKRKREEAEKQELPWLLDGEDRRRAGVKKKDVPLTGRWRSKLHDYFPDPENGVEGSGVLEDLDLSEKMLNRRILADYGEIMAKTARLTKAEERRRLGRN